MWHGYLCPTETGMHRQSLQSKFPGLDAFRKNGVENGDLSISTSGNLYIREAGKPGSLERIGMGTRISANGIANPFSEVVQMCIRDSDAGDGSTVDTGVTVLNAAALA